VRLCTFRPKKGTMFRDDLARWLRWLDGQYGKQYHVQFPMIVSGKMFVDDI
jgi:hypothetical protein